MSELRAICARLAGNELVAAECANLTGGRPGSDGIAVCQKLDRVYRAAYITTGIRYLAEGETLEALTSAIAQIPFPADSFRIEFLRLSPSLPIGKMEAIRSAANAIQGLPDLDAPRHRFLIGLSEKSIWFGEILAESGHTYQQHDAKPYRTSSSMPSRLARALVNLVSPPAKTILDPFCGTGSILLEAQAIGLSAYGLDWNPKMVGMSRKNVEYFGYTAEVERKDALECDRRADAIVTDLPYGRFLEMDEAGLLAILKHATQLAPVAVYLAEQDISSWLEESGYREIEVFRVRKRAGMSRYVHRAISGG